MERDLSYQTQSSQTERLIWRREGVPTTGGIANTREVNPILETEPLPETKLPLVIVNGWLAVTDVQDEAMSQLALSGRRVVSFAPPRKTDAITAAPLLPQYQNHGEPLYDYYQAEIQKLQTLIGVMAMEDLTYVDLLAHSEGAIVALIAAGYYPEKFRSIVLVNPAGLQGDDTVPALAKRFTAFLYQAMTSGTKYGATEEIKAVANQVARERAFVNPIRAVRDTYAIAHSTGMEELIRRAQANGIQIGMINGADDPVFPPGRVALQLERMGIELNAHKIVAGSHNSFPDDPTFVQEIIAMLEQLQNVAFNPG